MSSLLEIDILILRLIHHNRMELFDPSLLFITKSAYITALGIVLYLGILAFIKKQEGIKTIFIKLIFLLAVVTLIVLSLKYTILRTRPFDLYPDILNLSEANSPSLPSGHTVIGFTLAFGLLFSRLRWMYSLPVLAWSVIVAYSRVALGAHFLSDVLTSILIAFSVVSLYKVAVSANFTRNLILRSYFKL